MTRKPPVDWEAELHAFLRGDRAAALKFAAICRTYLHLLRAYAWSQYWDDVCQDALISFYAVVKRSTPQKIRHPISYLQKITGRTLWKQIQKHRGDPVSSGSIPLEKLDVLGEMVNRPESSVLLHCDVENCMKGLPDEERAVIELVVVQRVTYAEAAQQLDLPMRKIKELRSRGLRRLQRLLGRSYK